jgi:threonine/homoserine/homoserine lactone efflux protein
VTGRTRYPYTRRPMPILDERLLAFIGVAIAVVVIPGPDMALIARNVLRHGRPSGFATSIGVCTGILGWAVAAAIGVSTVLATSATLFTALKVAGAIYLIYLGISTLRQQDLDLPTARGGTLAQPWRVAWTQGLLSALLNPKLGVFFLTLLPQFISPGDDAGLRAMQLAVVFDLIGLIWLLVYVALLSAIGSTLRRPGPQRIVRWVTGTVLIALGVRVATERA